MYDYGKTIEGGRCYIGVNDICHFVEDMGDLEIG